MKLTKDQDNAKIAIWSAIDQIRGKYATEKYLNLVLFMLIWAKFLPQTNTSAIGFFDVLEPVDEIKKLDVIISKLSKATKFDIGNLIGIAGNRESFIEIIETLKTALIPAARLIAKGNKSDTEKVIDIIQDCSNAFSGRGGFYGFNKGILDFSNKVFDGLVDNNHAINCLYSPGVSSAYSFAKTRNIFIQERIIDLDSYTKGLISLYGEPLRVDGSYTDKNITFAAPPFGIKSKAGVEEYGPFKEDEDSKAIDDMHCKLIYLAHKNTKNTTIAITNLATLFSKTKGINYFRQKIIDKNWVDTIITFPSGLAYGTQIPVAMVILKKDRAENDEIQLIDFSNCKKDDEAKRGQTIIPIEEINYLYKIFKSKKKSETSLLISKEEIIKNDYALNFIKYFVSNEDKKILSTLNKRKLVPLEALVTFIRPTAIQKDAKGIELNEVMISDIDYIGDVKETHKKILVREDFLSKYKSKLIKKGDLILSIKGTLGKIGMVSTELENTIPGPSMCILRARDSALIDANYIFQYLRSDIGQRIISNSSDGPIPFISINDLKSLRIPIPSKVEQQKSKNIYQKSKELLKSITEMQAELDNCINNGWMQIQESSFSKNKEG